MQGPIPLVAALFRFARVRGVLATDVAARLGLRDVEQAEGVTPKILRALFEAVATETGEPHLGLRLASEQPLSGAHGSLDHAVGSSATVGEALRAMGPHAETVHPEVRAELLTGAADGRWTQRTLAGPSGIGRHAEEYALAFVVARCRRACPANPVRVTSLWFRHARPRDTGPVQRFFGTEILEFGAADSGFIIANDVLSASLAEPATAEFAVALPDSRSMSRAVTSRLPELLPDRATLEGTARALSVSTRTLQRRLEDEGSRFVDLLESVREATARTLLWDPSMTLSDVGERLGFSDLATFSRAFKRWTGMPPGTFRRARRGVEDRR